MARGGQLILLNNCLVTGTCHAKILVTCLGESRTCRMYFFAKIKNALVGYMTSPNQAKWETSSPWFQ